MICGGGGFGFAHFQLLLSGRDESQGFVMRETVRWWPQPPWVVAFLYWHIVCGDVCVGDCR